MKQDGVHGDHSGTKFVGDGVPVTAVVKMNNQLWSKHHSIEMKP